MTTAEIRTLPIDEKLRIMEALWEDLRANFDASPLSTEQKQTLDQRRSDTERGVAPLHDWEAVKGTIGRA